MRKAEQLAWGLTTAVLLLFAGSEVARARLTGTNPTGASADAWCSGKKSVEACVDSSGNVIPTTNNTQTLGTASLQYSNVYTTALTIPATGSATNSGASTLGTAGTANAAGTGNATNPSSLTVAGNLVLTASQVGTASGQNTGINISTTIPVNTSYETLISSGGNITLTSVPTIATTTVPSGATLIPNGTYLVLTSTASQTITLQSQGTLAGSGLRLGAATRVITVGNQLTLIFNSSVGQWVEAGFSAGTGN